MRQSIYYHVAGPEWRPGEDLVCYNDLAAEGRAPTWKWGDSPFAAADKDVVCLFESMLEADSFAAEFGGPIVEVRLPRKTKVIEVDEDYPAVLHRIPARALRLLSPEEIDAEL